MPRTVTVGPIDTKRISRDFTRADIEFHGLGHGGASYQGRVFLNLPDADESTSHEVREYAGAFHIFGHGGCLGDAGHCDVRPRRAFDPRPAHPLTPAKKVVIATDAVRFALAEGAPLTVTIVPVLMSTTPLVGVPDELVSLDRVQIVTYS